MREITYQQAICEALEEEMARDERVFVLGEDVGLYGGAFKATRGLFQKYGPERVIDTPISEAVIIGAALGAAITGLRPVAEIMFIDFTTIAMDQIVNQVAKIRYMLGGQVTAPLVIRTQGGALRGNAAQHSQSLEAWFVHIPGLKVVMPSTPYDAKGLLKTAIRDENPVMFIEHKLLYSTKGEVPGEEYLMPLGQAAVRRRGSDLTIAAYSRMALLAQEAAGRLSAEGIEAEVIDLRSLKPLDEETLFASVRKTGRLLVVYEGYRTLGFGVEVACRVSEECFDYLDAPVGRLGTDDVPIPYARPLEQAVIPSAEKIVAEAKTLLD